MRVHRAEFIVSSPDFESCPESTRPEFAFIGRSNVGKSSLVNMLTGKEKLAKVSKTPGHTKLINFFNVNDKWTLVDLPGYGYAKVARENREAFNEFVSDYIAERSNLACIFILIDSKIPPQALDLDFTRWVVECGIPFTLIWTKSDKVKAGALKKNQEAFLKKLAETCDGEPKCFESSSKTGDGRSILLGYIEGVLAKF